MEKARVEILKSKLATEIEKKQLVLTERQEMSLTASRALAKMSILFQF